MKQKRRTLEELNLIDDFLFFEAVAGEKGEQLCKLLIKAVCGREAKNVRIRPQNVIQGVDTAHRGIRMDLYVDDEGRCLYDFEPDLYTSSETLPKRNRYYRAMLDSRLLESRDRFEDLPDMWKVFIMSRDPFHKNRMCYTVKNQILEEPALPYEDGAVSLFLYTKGRAEGNEELSQLLKYIEESTEENAVTQELKELHDYIISIKKRKEVGVRYMESWEREQLWLWRQEVWKEAWEEGKAEGLAESKAKGEAKERMPFIEAILDLLSELGSIPEGLSERISSEEDREILCKWVKLAARAESPSDFEKKMKLAENG